MTSAPLRADDAVAAEFRKAADELLPVILGEVEGTDAGAESAAVSFVAEFGGSAEFAIYFDADPERRIQSERRLLSHFQNNIELLVRKTWVEKADEANKDKILDRVQLFVEDFSRGDFERALKTFTHITDELSYLLFGTQSRKADFIDYAFRIDTALGLFWWYAARISSALGHTGDARMRAAILIGVYYLTNF